MCHNDESRPPAPPKVGRVDSDGPTVLTTPDGNQLAAHRAVPGAPNGHSIVVIPDVRGLHPFYVDLTRRFAEAGFRAIALDFYGRSAGPHVRDESFEWREHMQQVQPEHVRADVEAARAALPDGPAFTVGFCFGGSHSWRMSATDLDLAGTIGFYGRPSLVDDVVEQMSKPVLMLVAGADQATPTEEFHELDRRIPAEHEMHVYEGAPHSFFDRAFEEWEQACADAWQRILDFTERHGATVPL